MDPPDPDAPYARDLVDAARRFQEGSRNHLGIAALGCSLSLIEEIGIERIEASIKSLTDYLVREVEKRGCRVDSPRSPNEWSGILLFAPPPGGPIASDLVSAMHGQRITTNARGACIHMEVHFYNTQPRSTGSWRRCSSDAVNPTAYGRPHCPVNGIWWTVT